MWRIWLTFYGFYVDAAADGAEALRLARAHRPDLVLMDLWMPVVDGLEAMRGLRAHPLTTSVPIIVLTASSCEIEAERARACGCDQILAKPVMPDQLLGHIRMAFRATLPQFL
jgi:CheY-like chemotaxis protein